MSEAMHEFAPIRDNAKYALLGYCDECGEEVWCEHCDSMNESKCCEAEIVLEPWQ